MKIVREEMDMQTALAIQQAQLNKWALVLKPEVMERLRAKVMAENRGVKNPYDVFRGNDIDDLVMNASHRGLLG